MGDQFFELIIFAGVALFLVYRLWGVLGRRTGAEPPPALRQANPSPNPVVDLPDRPRPAPPAERPSTPLQAGLEQIRRHDPNFTPERFIDGARHAFEIIVKAFAEGDTATLRPLVSDEVYDAFAEVIRHRLSVKESVDTRIERLQEPQVLDGRMEGRTAFVTVKFVSGQVSVTRDAAGKILEGDPERPVEHTDHWTFSRNTRAGDPNWILVATGTPE
jgi:predicted lipid-binding transport protein (Tim44 family)